MKNKFTLVFCFLMLITAITNAQDIITKKNGDDIQAKVIEITLNELKYKNFNNLDGPIISILKSDVILVRYENGSKDVFADEKPVSIEIGKELLDEETATFNGSNDAIRYYRGYGGAGSGTLVTGLFAGSIFALIPAILTSSSVPKDENLNYPSASLMKNPEYSTAYTQKAFKIKKKRVWNNYFYALAGNVVGYILLYNIYLK
jgi:hypothetical protein